MDYSNHGGGSLNRQSLVGEDGLVRSTGFLRMSGGNLGISVSVWEEGKDEKNWQVRTSFTSLQANRITERRCVGPRTGAIGCGWIGREA